MENNIIEVSYTDLKEASAPESMVSLTSAAGLPEAVIIKKVADVFNNAICSVKEYGMLKEQEKTKRDEIKAQLKFGLEQIRKERDCFIADLNKRYEKDMAAIRSIDSEINIRLDNYTNSINAAIEIAKEKKDFSEVIHLLELMNITQEFSINLRSNLMAQTSVMPNLGNGLRPVGLLE